MELLPVVCWASSCCLHEHKATAQFEFFLCWVVRKNQNPHLQLWPRGHDHATLLVACVERLAKPDPSVTSSGGRAGRAPDADVVGERLSTGQPASQRMRQIRGESTLASVQYTSALSANTPHATSRDMPGCTAIPLRGLA